MLGNVLPSPGLVTSWGTLLCSDAVSDLHAFITGIEGFVGQRLQATLEAKGWRVSGGGVSVSAETDRVSRLDVTAEAGVRAALEQARSVTHLFHLAAVTFVPDAMASPRIAFDINVGGTVNVAHALMETHPSARLIFISTGEVYGTPERLPMDESHPLRPTNPYAISKTAADNYVAYLARTTALDAICMRPFNHSGAGQRDTFVLSSFARQVARMAEGKAAPVLHVGNLEVARDFGHVDDVVEGYITAALHAPKGAIFNVCSGTATPLHAVLDHLRTLAGIDFEVVVDPDRLRPNDIPEVRGSHEALTQATGWMPRRSLEDVMAELLAAWREVEARNA